MTVVTELNPAAAHQGREELGEENDPSASGASARGSGNRRQTGGGEGPRGGLTEGAASFLNKAPTTGASVQPHRNPEGPGEGVHLQGGP